MRSADVLGPAVAIRHGDGFWPVPSISKSARQGQAFGLGAKAGAAAYKRLPLTDGGIIVRQPPFGAGVADLTTGKAFFYSARLEPIIGRNRDDENER